MMRIIDGKRYNTDTAVKVADVGSPGMTSRSDHTYEDTYLYRTKKGAWFLSGEGGPRSRWGRSVGNSTIASGSGLQPITPDEARELLEQHDETDAIERWFSDVVEDA